MKRPLRVALTLLVTGLATAYVIWKIDVSRTVEILGDTNVGYFAAAVALALVTTWPMALRWKWLLDAKGIHDRLAWLTRAYFVSYAASQVLPTAIGGDATRIYETARRHPGNAGTIAGATVLERAVGGAATLLLAGAGLALAVGEYDIDAYLWVEAIFVVLMVVGGFLIFSRRARAWLRWVGPVLARVEVASSPSGSAARPSGSGSRRARTSFSGPCSSSSCSCRSRSTGWPSARRSSSTS
jgi:uncharacterized protein (TIRG00374 family)